jgi:hypothetical protein
MFRAEEKTTSGEPMKRFIPLVAAAVISGGLLVSGASSASAAVPQSKATAARTALQKYMKQYQPRMKRAKHVSNVGDTYSYNWSGYADSKAPAKGFTEVGGSWTQPAVTCTNEDQLFSGWVGLDGYSTDTVEQDGTLAWCFEGVAYYYTWYEMYPAGTIEEGTSVQPGDSISAEVTANDGNYVLSVTDATNPSNSFSTTQTCATTTCLDASAEWVAERPAFSIGISPLADYGTWKVTGASVNSTKAISDTKFVPENMSMIDATDSYYLSTAGALKASGTSFTTTWLDSY